MASGERHVLALYPFPHLFLGVGLAALWRAGAILPTRLSWVPRGIVAAAFGLLLASNLALAATFHRRLAERGGTHYWRESIYDLSAALVKDHPDDVVELLDWGFDRPLILLAHDRLHLETVFSRVEGDPKAQEWLAELIRSPNRVFVRRAPQFAFSHKVHERFD